MIVSERTAELLFRDDEGIGFLSIRDPIKYGQEYFDRFAAIGRTAFGVALNSLRVGLVSRYLKSDETLVDVGVGDGAFMRARGVTTLGYDINPIACEMLRRQGRYFDTRRLMHAASFWDSLEHIENPFALVQAIATHCFVSIPIFRDREHILRSKHFKPAEHYWYFTRAGVIAWFWKAGFMCLEMNDNETSLGREDIGTFVFRRRDR